MTARTRKPTKRTIVIITSILGAGALATAGYFLYSSYSSKHYDTHPISESARTDAAKQVKDMNMVGDSTISETYLGYIKANRLEDAKKFFADKVSAEPDTQKKVQLLLQQQRLALSVDLKDQASDAVKQAVALAQTGETYAAMAVMYSKQQKYIESADYWQKAYDTVKDTADSQGLAEYYTQGRDNARTQADLAKEQS